MEYTIIRVYRVPGRTQAEATDRFAKAAELGAERDFHVKDIVKTAENKREERGRVIRGSWWALVKRQLLG